MLLTYRRSRTPRRRSLKLLNGVNTRPRFQHDANDSHPILLYSVAGTLDTPQSLRAPTTDSHRPSIRDPSNTGIPTSRPSTTATSPPPPSVSPPSNATVDPLHGQTRQGHEQNASGHRFRRRHFSSHKMAVDMLSGYVAVFCSGQHCG